MNDRMFGRQYRAGETDNFNYADRKKEILPKSFLLFQNFINIFYFLYGLFHLVPTGTALFV